jgi:metal-responsive CopG/Arc/MetJ family transcriptional regulator
MGQTMATKTLNIALDEKLINEIDETVRKDFSSRSEYFRRLALSDLERRRDWKSVLDAANAKGRKMGIRSEQQVYEILDNYKSDKQQT